MGNDYPVHQKTQKEIEKTFKLRPMMARGRDFKQWEVEWAKRYGFDIFKLRDEITAGFKKSKGGQQFKASLEAKGIVLCRGDKSQFVLILPWSQHKALSSMIMGRPTKAVLRRALGDININALPTVQEGKAIVKARLPKLKAKPRGKAGRALRPKTGRGRISLHAKSWGRYRGSVTSRRAKGATYPYKNTGISNNAAAISPLSGNIKREGGKTGGTGAAKRKAGQKLGTTNINPSPAFTSGKQSHDAAPASPSQTPNPLPPAVKPLGTTHKNGKDAQPEQQIPAPFRPASTSGMSEAQRIDLEAAQTGKITWAEYFKKWGGGDGPKL